MTRKSDITELLAEVEEISSALSKSYEVAKKDASVVQVSRAKVKSALEHLRSVLDYCALDIYLHTYGKSPGKLYFPYAKSEELFNKHLSKSFISIRERNPRIYALMASIQPHACDSSWLIDLCSYTNINKHNNFTSQTKEKSGGSVTVGNLVQVSGGGTVVFFNSTVNGVQIGKSSSTPATISATMTAEEIATQLNPENPYIPVTRIAEKIRFFIDGSNNDALAFIQDSKARIAQFVSELYLEIDR